MGNIVWWCEFNMWWETDLWRRGEMHPSDSWPHNRELCCGKPSDLTAGFVWESQSCVWFGDNSKTRALANPWDQTVCWTNMQQACPHHLFWFYSNTSVNQVRISRWNLLLPIFFCCVLVQSYLNTQCGLFFSRRVLLCLQKVACFTLNNNVIINIFCQPTAFFHDTGGASPVSLRAWANLCWKIIFLKMKGQ